MLENCNKTVGQDMSEMSAIILSGGLSTRMGEDKCSLLYKGKTFLEIQIDKFKKLGIADIVVSGFRGENCKEKVIIDDIMKGPLSGIYLGLKNIKNKCAFVVSVDTPLLSVDVIEKMIYYSKNITFDALVLKHNDKVEPLISIFKKDILEKLKIYLDGERFPVRGFLELIDFKYFDYNIDEDIFFNVNNKSDYDKLINMC